MILRPQRPTLPLWRPDLAHLRYRKIGLGHGRSSWDSHDLLFVSIKVEGMRKKNPRDPACFLSFLVNFKCVDRWFAGWWLNKFCRKAILNKKAFFARDLPGIVVSPTIASKNVLLLEYQNHQRVVVVVVVAVAVAVGVGVVVVVVVVVWIYPW